MTETAVPVAAGPRWRTAPRRPVEAATSTSPVAREVIAALVGVGGVLLRAHILPAGDDPVLLGVGLAATALLAAIPERRWFPRVVIPIIAGAVLRGPEGEGIALWIILSLILADWGIRGHRPLWFLPQPRPTVIGPVCAISVVAAYQGTDLAASIGPSIITMLGLAVTANAGWGGPVYRTIERLAAAVGNAARVAVSTVLFSALGLLVVVVPWVLQRVVRFDPLDPGGTRRRGWLKRDRLHPQSSEPWPRDAVPFRRSRASKARIGILGFAALAAFLIFGPNNEAPLRAIVTSMPGAPKTQARTYANQYDTTPAAYKDAPWFDEYQRDIIWVMNPAVAWRPLRPIRILDVSTKWVNVVDGRRATWTPPACTCKRVKVWLYGASTTFGIGQRDDHTIASELARAAWKNGIALDVWNRGQPGQTHWTEATRFQWDVTVDPAPDLVLFYDGANEVWAAAAVGIAGLTGTNQPVEPLTEDLIRGEAGQVGEAPHPPPGGRVAPTTPDPHLNSEQKGRLAIKRYATATQMSRDTATARRLRVRWYYQPSRLSRPPQVGEVEIKDPQGEKDLRSMYRAAERRIPTGVVDLTHVFDDVTGPIFSDDVHTNERGARIVAESMYRDIAPQLAELLAPTAAPR